VDRKTLLKYVWKWLWECVWTGFIWLLQTKEMNLRLPLRQVNFCVAEPNVSFQTADLTTELTHFSSARYQVFRMTSTWKGPMHCRLLGCDALKSCLSWPLFQWNHGDEGCAFLLNYGNHLKKYTLSQHRIWKCMFSPSWEPQMYLLRLSKEDFVILAQELLRMNTASNVMIPKYLYLHTPTSIERTSERRQVLGLHYVLCDWDTFDSVCNCGLLL
jgi:hypothetical protein